jgi:hypothetical protein
MAGRNGAHKKAGSPGLPAVQVSPMSIRYLRRGRHSAVCISTAATLRATAAAEASVNSDIHMARSLLLVLPQSPIERAVNAGPIIPFLELGPNLER